MGRGLGSGPRLSWAASALASPAAPPLRSRPAPTVPEVGGRALDHGGRTQVLLALAPAQGPGFPSPVPAGSLEAHRATRLEPSPPGRPQLLRARRAPGSEPGRREGGREQQAATRKRHIRSRKDPPPEQPLYGQRLIWSAQIWPGCFRLREEGRRRREGAGATPGTTEQLRSGSPQLWLEH